MTAEESVHFAHSRAGGPLSEWHKLEQHLRDTAELAEAFTSAFAPGWGRIAGLWHDAGKYQGTFQKRMGAWIETTQERLWLATLKVAPRAGRVD
jgi:hypothetical protein